MHSTEPTTRDVRIFGLLWPLFFGALAAFAVWRPGALLTVSIVLGSAWLVALVAQPAPFAARRRGWFVPALLAFAGGGVRAGLPPEAVVGTLIAVGLAGALTIVAAPRAGAAVYRWWIAAAEPIGWTVSLVLLALVYYVVVTPIGLLLRLAGRDPLERRPDPGLASYWIERPRRVDPQRYFRQF